MNTQDWDLVRELKPFFDIYTAKKWYLTNSRFELVFFLLQELFKLVALHSLVGLIYLYIFLTLN